MRLAMNSTWLLPFRSNSRPCSNITAGTQSQDCPGQCSTPGCTLRLSSPPPTTHLESVTHIQVPICIEPTAERPPRSKVCPWLAVDAVRTAKPFSAHYVVTTTNCLNQLLFSWPPPLTHHPHLHLHLNLDPHPSPTTHLESITHIQIAICVEAGTQRPPGSKVCSWFAVDAVGTISSLNCLKHSSILVQHGGNARRGHNHRL